MINERVFDYLGEPGRLKEFEKARQFIADTAAKYPLVVEGDVACAMLALNMAGFGRGARTVQVLRCLAEMLESPEVPCAETIEAQMDQQLQ